MKDNTYVAAILFVAFVIAYIYLKIHGDISRCSSVVIDHVGTFGDNVVVEFVSPISGGDGEGGCSMKSGNMSVPDFLSFITNDDRRLFVPFSYIKSIGIQPKNDDKKDN